MKSVYLYTCGQQVNPEWIMSPSSGLKLASPGLRHHCSIFLSRLKEKRNGISSDNVCYAANKHHRTPKNMRNGNVTLDFNKRARSSPFWTKLWPWLVFSANPSHLVPTPLKWAVSKLRQTAVNWEQSTDSEILQEITTAHPHLSK